MRSDGLVRVVIAEHTRAEKRLSFQRCSNRAQMDEDKLCYQRNVITKPTVAEERWFDHQNVITRHTELFYQGGDTNKIPMGCRKLI